MARRFLLVGLTGGIASGKSAVSRMLNQLGCLIIDADLIAREVVEPGEPAYQKIVEAFGQGILDDEGYVNRKKLGALIFRDAEKRRLLNEITHPEIIRREQEILAELMTEGHEGIVVLDAALLIEAGGAGRVDRLVVVTADEATQQKRLSDRDDLPAEEALRRIRSQMPLSEKAKLAHYVINNSGTPHETLRQVQEVYQTLQADLQEFLAADP
ncbi:MAG TPA: dephospho-CoA kinase [Methylomirabilota bacterium]|nr:dephospho-CoA kinase [Methylomirabilota bacterium]